MQRIGVLILTCCFYLNAHSQDILGTYTSRFAPFGFVTSVTLLADSVVYYKYSGGLYDVADTGTFTIHQDTLVLHFAPYKLDSTALDILATSSTDRSLFANPAATVGPKIFLIKKQKLYIINQEGKLVKRALYEGKSNRMKRFFLEKI